MKILESVKIFRFFEENWKYLKVNCSSIFPRQLSFIYFWNLCTNTRMATDSALGRQINSLGVSTSTAARLIAVTNV